MLLLYIEAAYGLVHGLEDERAVLGEEVAVYVLGGLDFTVAHLVGDLHIGRARGDQEARAYVPQFVRGVFDDAVLMGRGVAVGQFQVTAPHRVTEIAAALAVDQPSVEFSFGALSSGGAAFGQAADSGHRDIRNGDGSFGGPRLEVGADITAPA